jgi:hypothetical protein
MGGKPVCVRGEYAEVETLDMLRGGSCLATRF